MQPADIVNSLADFAFFLDQRLGLSKRTIAAYTSDARSFARFLLHECKEPTPRPDQSDHDLIARLVSWLKTDRRNGPATIRRKLISLKAYFRWSTDHGLVGRSPFENERIAIRLPKRLPRALSRSDTIRLLHGPSSPSETDLALRLLLATGIRIGEMCAIEACDVASDGSALRIKGKGDRERTAFIANPLLQRHLALLTASRLGISRFQLVGVESRSLGKYILDIAS